jgi:hypothetical protein
MSRATGAVSLQRRFGLAISVPCRTSGATLPVTRSISGPTFTTLACTAFCTGSGACRGEDEPARGAVNGARSGGDAVRELRFEYLRHRDLVTRSHHVAVTARKVQWLMSSSARAPSIPAVG